MITKVLQQAAEAFAFTILPESLVFQPMRTKTPLKMGLPEP
jgi:hypothetical protein